MNDAIRLRDADGAREGAPRREIASWLEVDRVLVLVAAFTIVASLIGLAAALAGVFHAQQVLMASLLLTGWYAYRTQGQAAALPGLRPSWWHIGLLLLVALFFRLPAYHYVLGAQDEGLYTNMAQHLDRTGRIDARDEVMEKLEGTPYLQKYLQDNRVYEGNSTTLYVAGVYARQPPTGHLIFQFYYLFPVWLALAGGIFGSAVAVYALTFFALLSIVFFYRLALLLTHSGGAALVAGALLVLNPLHAFFSKFPVTEMQAVAFSLIGFTLLAAHWTAASGDRQTRWLWLSVLAFLCLFTSRISGFMYVPFFVALAVATLICDQDAQRRHAIQRWAIGVVIAYVASIFYGLRWSRYYSRDTYLTSFEPLLGQHWKLLVELAVIAGLVIWSTVAMWTRRPERRQILARWTVHPLNLSLGLIVLVALLVGLLKIYWLGWTNHYAGLGWDTRWHLMERGWVTVSASSLSTLFVYLGPLLMLAFFGLIGRRQNDPRLAFLRLFIAGFFVYAMLLVWVIPYAAYYARYLLSEVVPYLILFVVCVWSGLRPGGARSALSAVLFLSLVYAAALSAAQVGKNEDDGAYEALARLVAPVEPNDVILLDTLNRPPNTSIIKTPLVYIFGRNVVTVGNDALTNPDYIAELNSIYDDLFLISSWPSAPRGYSLIDSVRFRAMTYEHTHFFPRRLVPAQDVVLYLFRLDLPQFPLDSTQLFRPGATWMVWLREGWNAPESWGLWSQGQHSQLDIDPRQLPNMDGLVLQLDARVLVAPNHRQQRVRVSVNGMSVGNYVVHYPVIHLEMRIPINRTALDGADRIRIDFALPDAISPKAIDAGSDTRELAIGLLDATVNTGPAVSRNAAGDVHDD